MPAERRNATKIRGQSRWNDDLDDPLRRRQAQRARHFHQSRLDAADRSAAQDQHWPDAGKCDNHDLHAISKSERDQRDRQQRNRRDRTDCLDGHFHQPIEDSRKTEGYSERKPDDATDREPREYSEQRVTRGDRDREVGECCDQSDEGCARRRQAVALQMSEADPELEDEQHRDRQQEWSGALELQCSVALMKSKSCRRSRRNSGCSRVASWSRGRGRFTSSSIPIRPGCGKRPMTRSPR